jgi:hypothetical protein
MNKIINSTDNLVKEMLVKESEEYLTSIDKR